MTEIKVSSRLSLWQPEAMRVVAWLAAWGQPSVGARPEAAVARAAFVAATCVPSQRAGSPAKPAVDWSLHLSAAKENSMGMSQQCYWTRSNYEHNSTWTQDFFGDFSVTDRIFLKLLKKKKKFNSVMMSFSGIQKCPGMKKWQEVFKLFRTNDQNVSAIKTTQLGRNRT